MIAVTILTFAVAGLLYTASRVLVAVEIARDKLTASYLAQEGIEYVRAMRDHEYLKLYGGDTSAAWNNFLTGMNNAGSIAKCRTTTCTLDTYPTVSMGTGSGFSLQQGSSNKLYLVNGFYTQKSDIGGVQTPFIRTIQVVDVSATDVRILSTVSWSFHGIPYTVTVTDHLTPWQ